MFSTNLRAKKTSPKIPDYEELNPTFKIKYPIERFKLKFKFQIQTCERFKLKCQATGGPSSLHERGRDSSLRVVLCYKRLFIKASVGCMLPK